MGGHPSRRIGHRGRPRPRDLALSYPITTVRAALKALGPPGLTLETAEVKTPDSPGLYAVYADGKAWDTLGLRHPDDDRPLYVGKAESSLMHRDIRQHFRDGRTGSSTLRRSFAALLRDRLKLEATPRNPAKPERFANFGLTLESDRRLTAWMRENLRLAFWPSPAGIVLAGVETVVYTELQPPLNLQGVSTDWTAQVSLARGRMARDARRWALEDSRSGLRTP